MACSEGMSHWTFFTLPPLAMLCRKWFSQRLPVRPCWQDSAEERRLSLLVCGFCLTCLFGWFHQFGQSVALRFALLLVVAVGMLPLVGGYRLWVWFGASALASRAAPLSPSCGNPRFGAHACHDGAGGIPLSTDGPWTASGHILSGVCLAFESHSQLSVAHGIMITDVQLVSSAKPHATGCCGHGCEGVVGAVWRRATLNCGTTETTVNQLHAALRLARFPVVSSRQGAPQASPGSRFKQDQCLARPRFSTAAVAVLRL